MSESFATDWAETLAPDEAERFAGYARELVELQRRRNARDGAGRALHRKAHVGVRATFTVRDDLSAVLRVGPFARPATYEALVRFSNGASRRGKDSEPDIRGVAVKLLGVAGPKVLGDARTQDFLFIHRSVQPFRDPDEFMRFVRVANGNQATLPFRMIGAFGFGRALSLLAAIAKTAGAKVDSLATTRWSSASPIRWGATAVRYALAPVDPAATTTATGPGRLAEEMAARLRAGAVRFDFEVQGFVDAAATPVEDASVDWPSAHVAVGRLEIPTQDVESEAGRSLAAEVERYAFDPWHAVEELRPVGSMMRARKEAYFASSQERGTLREPG
jgi:hypothetical protein